ncbi:MAG: phenylalanine--tRNA ligase subunit beta [Elusimicrobiota bacterium]|nr:phenylalanine--tRNA ligase subunit beta [Elusimicrobiota bacterium]
MKISYNWLKTHIDLELSAKDLADHLLSLGFEVAGIERLGAAFSGVVVGKVLSKDKHPNADKLAVCVVDDGAKKWSVVCGAPNVDAGQTIAFARIGAVLPGDFKIEGRKLRGVESQGMICSRAELGLPKDNDGIWVLGEGPALGSDVGALLGPADDVLEVEVTSNRPDCLSHRGLARELAAYFKRPLKPLASAVKELHSVTASVTVEDPAACPLYGARVIDGVKVGPSPDWLKRRLESIGLRPVNNVVDATNFILHDCGQPLHAFDADRLAGGKLVVRRSKAGETLLALDHKSYALPAGLLVIADAEKPVALAGVMGGEESAVTEKTHRVILESAYFAPAEARRSSQATRLRSDSSYRFERGADAGATAAAGERATALIAELAGGKPGKVVFVESRQPARPPIRATVERLNKVLGSDFDATAVRGVLSSIAADLKDEGGAFVFTAPSWRHDLAGPNDLAEEVGRFLGYDGVPYRMAPAAARAARVTPVEAESRRARAALAALGLSEAYHYDLLSEKTLAACRLDSRDLPRVANPLSEDWAVLRPSLLPGLLRSAAYNLNRGADAVRLFEVGKTYGLKGAEPQERWRVAGLMLGPVLDARWQGARAPRAGYPDAKACVEELLSRAGVVTWAKLGDAAAGVTASDPLFHPVNAARALVGGVPAATVGWLHPRAARAFDLEREAPVVFDADLELLAGKEAGRTKFAPISPYPTSRRDLALVLDRATPYGRVEAVIAGLKLADLQDVLLFDVYEGKGVPEGKRSLAIRLTFGRLDRTLTDAEVSASVESVVAALGKDLGAVLRS